MFKTYTMKQLLIFFIVGATLAVASCTQDRYYDLTAGEYVDLRKDETTGKIVNAKTNETVYMYVDTRTNDTIYGPTGKVINGYVIKTDGGKYVFDEERYKFKHDDYKEKPEGDEAKLKIGHRTIKTEDDERKSKNDN